MPVVLGVVLGHLSGNWDRVNLDVYLKFIAACPLIQFLQSERVSGTPLSPSGHSGDIQEPNYFKLLNVRRVGWQADCWISHDQAQRRSILCHSESRYRTRPFELEPRHLSTQRLLSRYMYLQAGSNQICRCARGQTGDDAN